MGNFLADFYLVNGLVLESRKRREHLSEEDILRNKAIMESLSKGGNLIEQNFEVSPFSRSLSQLLRLSDGLEGLIPLDQRIAASPRSQPHSQVFRLTATREEMTFFFFLGRTKPASQAVPSSQLVPLLSQCFLMVKTAPPVLEENL